MAQQAHRGYSVWWECQTCEQEFTGPMQTGLGQAWWSWVHDDAEESEERLCAAHNLTHCRFPAKQIEREMLGVRRRMLGEEHAETLATASNLVASLSHQAKYTRRRRKCSRLR